MEDAGDNTVDDENYFSLLDMFICTRSVGKLLTFDFKIMNVIHLLETFSYPFVRVLASRRTSSGWKMKSG